MGKSLVSLKKLSSLLSHLLQQQQEALEKGEEEEEKWEWRRERVELSIASSLLTLNDYLASISQLKHTIKRLSSKNTKKRQTKLISLLSILGRVYLHSGNEKMASIIFSRVEHIFSSLESSEEESSTQWKVLILQNKASLAIAKNDYKEASNYFEETVSLQPNNVILLNNNSVAKLYVGDLSSSLSALENTLFSDPKNNLEEVLVKNISTLYDLACENSQDKKKEILKLITKFSAEISWN